MGFENAAQHVGVGKMNVKNTLFVTGTSSQLFTCSTFFLFYIYIAR